MSVNSSTSNSEIAEPVAEARGGRNDRSAFKYLLALAGSAAFVVGSVVLVISWLNAADRLAAPPITASLSFDEKLRFLRQNKPGRCDILCVGSSMAVNNVDSETLIAGLDAHQRYLNVASFGMKIGNTRTLARHLVPRLTPGIVVLVCSPVDFFADRQLAGRFNWSAIDAYVDGEWLGLSVAKHFDLQYFLKYAPELPQLRHARTQYASVCFDAGGAVPLQIEFPNVDKERWNDKVNPRMFDSDQRLELGSLARELRERNIKFLVVQSPLRSSSIDRADEPAVEEHWATIARILSENGAEFLNLHQSLLLDDSNFADYSHLNVKGARAFTRVLLHHLRVRVASVSG